MVFWNIELGVMKEEGGVKNVFKILRLSGWKFKGVIVKEIL